MELEFRPVVTGNIDRLRPFYEVRPNKTCDSVFLDGFLWRDYYHVQCTAGKGRTALWLTEKGERVSTTMSLYREEDPPHFFQQMVDYFSEVFYKPFYTSLADEEAVQYLNPDPALSRVEGQVDSKGYLYSDEELRKLEGRKSVKERSHLNGFKRTYKGRYEYRHLCYSDRHRVWQFMEHWRQHREEMGAMELSLDYEVAGIYDTLKDCSSLYVRMAGVYIDRQLEAFTAGSLNVQESMAVTHVEKANPEIRGLYQLINQQLLTSEFPQAELMNQEDDVGTEGLRKAKVNYYPIRLAREYTVRGR